MIRFDDMREQYIKRAPKDKDNPYRLINRHALEDRRMSFDARGALGFILVKPDTWKINVKNLMKEGGIGRDKTYRIINEWIASGYCERIENRVQGRVAGYDYIIHESPLPEKPDTAEPDTAEPLPANTDHSNKEVVVVNKLSNKETASSKENQPTNHETLDQNTDAETNNGWLVGSSFSEDPRIDDSDLNSTEIAQQIVGLLQHPAVCVSDVSTIRRLSAAGALEHVFRHVAHWWALPGANGAGLLVWRIRENMPLPDGLPDGFAETDIFEQFASEEMRAAASADDGDGYRVPEEFADMVIG